MCLIHFVCQLKSPYFLTYFHSTCDFISVRVTDFDSALNVYPVNCRRLTVDCEVHNQRLAGPSDYLPDSWTMSSYRDTLCHSHVIDSCPVTASIHSYDNMTTHDIVSFVCYACFVHIRVITKGMVLCAIK